MEHAFYGSAHAACSTGYHFHGAFQCKAVKVGHFVFSNSLYLFPVYFAYLGSDYFP